MADNTINIDLVLNAAASAKTLKEQRVALKELQSTLGQLEQGTDAFDKVASAAGNLKDGIADLRAQTNFYADDLRTLSGLSDIGSGIAAGFGLATSALEALGVGSENAQDAIKKLEIAQTALVSIQTIGNLVQKESAGNILITNALKKVGITLTAAEGAAVEGLTIKQRILNLVQKASPMGILIGVVGALTAAYAIFGNKTKEVTEEQKALNTQLEKTRADGEIEIKTFNSQIEALKKLKTGSEERAIAIKAINDTYGTTLKNLSDETAFLKQVNIAQADYVAGAKRRIEVKINESKVESFLTQAQTKREQSRFAAAKAQEILDKNDTLRKQLKGKTDQEILNSTFVSSEGIEFARLTSLKVTAQKEADALNKRADNALNINAKLITKETAQQKDARLKADEDAKKAEEKRLADLQKADKKAVDLANKTFKSLLELRQKAADQLIETQLELQKTQLSNEENYYDESLGEFESYNKLYLQEFNSAQDALLQNQKDLNNQQLNEELESAKTSYEQVISQDKIGNEAKKQALVDYLKIQDDLRNRYALKDQAATEATNKVKLTQQKEIEAKLLQIRQQARQEELNRLQENLDLAESALITYNQKVSVLLQSQVPSFAFPETENLVSAIDNQSQAYTDLKNIVNEINGENSIYKKDLDAIYAKHRKGIVDAVKAGDITTEAQKAAGIIDTNRDKVNQGLAEANSIMAKEFTALLEKVDEAQKAQLKTMGMTEEYTKELTFINERAEKLKEYSKLVAKVAEEEALAAKGMGNMTSSTVPAIPTPYGDAAMVNRTTALDLAKQELETFKEINKNYISLQTESESTIQNWYKLVNQAIILNDVFDQTVEKGKPLLGNAQDIVTLKENELKLTYQQRAELIIQNVELKEFYNSQVESNKVINEVLEERRKKLVALQGVEKFERQQQTVQVYVDSSKKIAEQLKIDGENFDKFGRNRIQQILKIDSLENAAQKDKIRLVAETTAILNSEVARSNERETVIRENAKQTFEAKMQSINNLEKEELKAAKTATEKSNIEREFSVKRGDAIVANEKTTNEAIEKEREKLAGSIEKITLNSALKQNQIDENLVLNQKQRRQELLKATLDFVKQGAQLLADFYTRQSEIEISNIERRKQAALDQFDLDMKYEEMKRNDAEIKDFQEAVRQKEIADRRFAIEEEYNAKIREEKRRAFNAQKAASIIEIGINTAVAISSLLALPIAAVLVGIAGAAQAAFVASQPTPEFAKGGILNGPSHSQGGIMTQFGELEGGEAVINKKSTKMFAPMLSAINQAGGGVQFAGGGIIPTQTVITEDTSKLNRIEMMLERFANKPILTYVNESEVTRAQRNQKKIEKRTSF